MNMPDADFLFEFRKFIDQHVDCRLEAMLTANHDDHTVKLESKIEELESKTEELESELSYHEDRITDLEQQIESIDRSQLLKDATAIIDRRIHELASRGQLRIYVASTESVNT